MLSTLLSGLLLFRSAEARRVMAATMRRNGTSTLWQIAEASRITSLKFTSP
jgi:hypothetical protein